MSGFGDLDPLDISQGVPHEAYRRLRAEAPVYRTPSGTWLRSRRDGVLAATPLRECCADVEIRGTKIRRGEKVAFGLASANRDEGHYDEPDLFRLDRARPSDHLAFGGGPHVCPGSALARLEGRACLEVLCRRVAEMALDPGFRWRKVPNFWAIGPEALPVDCVAA